jgi:hypothetical protein
MEGKFLIRIATVRLLVGIPEDEGCSGKVKG